MKLGIWTIAALAASAAVASAQEIKIATVDLQRTLNECDSGKRAKEEFKGEVDKLQASLQKQKEDLERIKVDAEKKASVLKDEERKNIEKDYQRRLRDFQRTYKDSQAELQARDNELTAEILREIQEVLIEYGLKSPYNLILEASNTGVVLYGTKNLDITDQIIEAYNAKRKSGGTKKK